MILGICVGVVGDLFSTMKKLVTKFWDYYPIDSRFKTMNKTVDELRAFL